MHLRNIIIMALIAMLFVSLAMQPVAAQQPESSGQVSFVWFANVGSDAPPVDIYFGNATQPVVSELSFGEVTPMYVFPANERGFTMRKADSAPDGAPIFSGNWGLTPNQSYIILATGLVSKQAFILEPITLVRNNTQGKARLRIINTISNSPPLTVVDNVGTTLGTNLLYLRVADINRDPGSADLILQNANGETVTTENVDFKADTVYVALITGDSMGGFPIDIQILEIPQETTRVRIINDANASYNVILRQTSGETTFVSNLAPNASGDFTDVPSGAASFIVKSTDLGADSRELAVAALQLRPSRDVTLTIQTVGAQLQIVTSSTTLTEGLLLGGSAEMVEATTEATSTPEVMLQATASAVPPTATTEATVEATSVATTEPTSEPTIEPTLEPTQEGTPAS